MNTDGNYKSLRWRSPLLHQGTSTVNKLHASDPLIARELHKKSIYVLPPSDPRYNVELKVVNIHAKRQEMYFVSSIILLR